MGRPGRPYRVPLDGDAPPEALIAGLDSADRPGALWGSWFGGGACVFRRPVRAYAPEHAEQAFAALDEQPDLADVPDGVVGGGWLAAHGYGPGATALAYYDSLLRWQDDTGWTFEALGLPGRQDADAAALAHWRRALDRAGLPPVARSRPEFGLRGDPEAAQVGYLGAVEDVIGRIHRGDFYQLNLCLRLHASTAEPGPALFARVAARLRPAYAALVPGPGGRLVASFSPELFLRVRGRRVTTSPIKGTAPRTAAGAAALRSSTKDAAENVMIVDLMRNDLSRVCRPGTVTVDELLDVQAHPGVWHLVSTVHGELADGVGPAALLEATFPPGSVTGAPKHAARRAIAALEPEPRAAYTGAAGLVTPGAGTELNVLIRTFELDGDRLDLGVGGGITADSVPVREWYECLHKAAPLVAAAGGTLAAPLADEPGPPDPTLSAAGVFESVLVVGRTPLRLAGHLARLDRSCRELYGLGLPTDLAARVGAVLDGVEPLPRRALRVTARPQPDALAIELTTRVLGGRMTRSALVHAERPDRSWRHKWVDRAGLDHAAHRAAPALPYFTAAGQVTEADRGNLFWRDTAGRWGTPPLDEAVLPGVTRREVLDLLAADGTPVEIRRGSPADLGAATGAFWTSSLSGAVAVTAVDGAALPDATAYAAELTRRLGL